MDKRAFSKKCGECGQRAMALATVPYTIRIDHDGQKYDVSIPAFVVPKCGNCGAVSIDVVAEQQISLAFHEQARLLTPDAIVKCRKDLGLTQKQMACLMGISDATLSRWETGSQVQQRGFDKFLRAFFASPWVRWYLQALQTGEVPETQELALVAQVQPIPEQQASQPAT